MQKRIRCSLKRGETMVRQNQMIRRCAKFLRLYDSRLVNPGAHVAYIAQAIVPQMPPPLFDVDHQNRR